MLKQQSTNHQDQEYNSKTKIGRGKEAVNHNAPEDLSEVSRVQVREVAGGVRNHMSSPHNQ